MPSKTKGWPPERRKAQAARIRAQKPWLQSTGPRTNAGKDRVKFNAVKHGNRAFLWRELRHVLKLHRIYLKQINQKMKKRRLKPRGYQSDLAQLMDLLASMYHQASPAPAPRSSSGSAA